MKYEFGGWCHDIEDAGFFRSIEDWFLDNKITNEIAVQQQTTPSGYRILTLTFLDESIHNLFLLMFDKKQLDKQLGIFDYHVMWYRHGQEILSKEIEQIQNKIYQQFVIPKEYLC